MSGGVPVAGLGLWIPPVGRLGGVFNLSISYSAQAITFACWSSLEVIWSTEVRSSTKDHLSAVMAWIKSLICCCCCCCKVSCTDMIAQEAKWDAIVLCVCIKNLNHSMRSMIWHTDITSMKPCTADTKYPASELPWKHVSYTHMQKQFKIFQ